LHCELSFRRYNTSGLTELALNWQFLTKIWKPDTVFLNGQRYDSWSYCTDIDEEEGAVTRPREKIVDVTEEQRVKIDR
jgi:hypothetical protein